MGRPPYTSLHPFTSLKIRRMKRMRDRNPRSTKSGNIRLTKYFLSFFTPPSKILKWCHCFSKYWQLRSSFSKYLTQNWWERSVESVLFDVWKIMCLRSSKEQFSNWSVSKAIFFSMHRYRKLTFESPTTCSWKMPNLENSEDEESERDRKMWSTKSGTMKLMKYFLSVFTSSSQTSK